MTEKRIGLVHLRRMLEFLMFVKTPLRICDVENPGAVFQFQITALGSDSFKATCCTLVASDSETIATLKTINRKKIVRMPYKNHGLLFETRVISIRQSEQPLLPQELFTFLLPEYAVQIENRPVMRTKFDCLQKNGWAVITMRHQRKPAVCRTSHLRDFTSDTISVFLNEGGGRFNEKDAVSDVRLYAGRRLLCTAPGRIMKLAPVYFASDRQKRLLLVIHMGKGWQPPEQTMKRKGTRFALLGKLPVYVSFQHPLIRERFIYGQMQDISEFGVLFIVRQSIPALFPGLIIRSARIQMPCRLMRPLSIKIVHVNYIHGALHVGAVFSKPDATVPHALSRVAEPEMINAMVHVVDQPVSWPVDDGNISISITRCRSNGTTGRLSARLVSFSLRECHCLVAREQGLLLPGDCLDEITIRRHSHIVLHSTATVEQSQYTIDGNSVRQLVKIQMQKPLYIKYSIYIGSDRLVQRISVVSRGIVSYLDFPHPLAPEYRVIGHIQDISDHGLSFLVKKPAIGVLQGSVIDAVNIQLPDSPRFTVRMIVVHCQLNRSADTLYYRFGARFMHVGPDGVKAIGNFLNAVNDPHIIESLEDNKNAVWEFFFQSGFIYTDKQKHLQKFAGRIFNTHQALLRAPVELYKYVLFIENDEIKGHVSAIRYFDHAWMVQHLAAEKTESGSAGKAVLLKMVEFFRTFVPCDRPKQKYMVFYYQEKKLYPATVFGGITEAINDNDTAGFETLDYCVLVGNPVRCDHSGRNPEPDIREANADDLPYLEQILVNAQMSTLMRIENLTLEGSLKLDVSAEYESAGLYRRRRIFVVFHAGTNTRCFAVCNYATPGLNFSELTNSFRLYFSHNDTMINASLAESLVPTIIESYQQTDMDMPVLLKNPRDPTPSVYEVRRVYRYFYFDLFHVDSLKTCLNDIFNDFKDKLRKRQRSDSGAVGVPA